MTDYKIVNGISKPLTLEEQLEHDNNIVTFASTQSVQARILADLAAHRYSVENGGVIIAGNKYDTDYESRLALTAVFIIASSNNAFTANWKMSDGTFVNLNASDIIIAATGVLAFVQKCFDTEKVLTNNVAVYASSTDITSTFDTLMLS